MAKDYKNRIPAYRQRRQRAARIRAIVGAAVAGIAGLAALGVYLFSDSEGESAARPAATAAGPAPGNAAGTGAARPASSDKAPSGDASPPDGNIAALSSPPPLPLPEPRFSFYKLLPEKEVIVAESEIKTMKREESQGKKPAAAPYLLQAGSFTRREDAERLKARLAEIKIKAKLEMIKLDNTAWYRVKIGPYATLADADKVRQYLRANKIDSVVQKAAP